MAKIIEKSEKSILVICALLIAIFIYFLNNLNILIPMSDTDSQKLLLGQIVATKLDVRQKFRSDYTWQTTSSHVPVSEGDSLFTGPKSSCEITLADGQKLLIAENSLIRFSRKSKRLSIDLAFGKLSATGLTTELEITDCGQSSKVAPNGSNFVLSKGTQCGTMDIDVKEGEVNVNSKAVTKIKRKPKKVLASLFPDKVQTAEIFKNTKFAPPIEKIPKPILPPVVEIEPVIPLETPAFAKSIFTTILAKDAKINLRWSASPLAEQYTLEIADTSSFINAKKIDVSDTSYSFTPLRDGSYFFRVKATTADGLESSVSEPARAQFTYPSIELQQKQIVVEYKARSPSDFGAKKSFPVRWSPIALADKYVVEMDETSNFLNPVKFASRSPASAVEVPKTGNYNYRVLAYDKKGRQISSTSEPGQISYQRIFNIAAPIIEASLKSISYYFQKGLGQFIWLRWNQASAELKDLKYHIQISGTAQFTQLTFDGVTPKNKFLMNNNLPQGTYFWRVRSETPDQYSEWSDVGSIKVQTKKTN